MWKCHSDTDVSRKSTYFFSDDFSDLTELFTENWII